MVKKSQQINIKIATQYPLNCIGMKEIVSLCFSTAQISTHIGELNRALLSIDETPTDLLITDMYNGDNTQVQVARLLLTTLQLHSHLKIIVYNRFLIHEAHELFQDCPQVSVLSNDVPIKNVYQAITNVLEGERHYYPSISHDQQNTISDARLLSLTYSEKKVLLLLLNGHSQSEIARSLSRNIKTISTHKRNIMRKLCFKSDPELFLRKNELLFKYC